jgi:hypothetical protein
VLHEVQEKITGDPMLEISGLVRDRRKSFANTYKQISAKSRGDNPVNLEDLISSLYDDRMRTMLVELRRMELEIAWRRIASVEASATMLNQISELSKQILLLQAENDGVPDFRRQERSHLERDRRDVQQRLHQESVQAWRDIQPLRAQQGHLLKEGTEEQQRYDRMTELLYDA